MARVGETVVIQRAPWTEPPLVSRGTLLRGTRNIRTLNRHVWMTIPGLFIILAVRGLDFLGDGLRDAVDRYAATWPLVPDDEGGAAMSTPTDHANLPPLEADYSISDGQVDRFWREGFVVLRAVLSPREIRAYGAVIRETAMRRFAAKEMQAAAHGAFLQTLGLRFDSAGVRRFCLAPRFGAIAARLLQVPAVRIFHEQALFKQPGGSDSHWHQDQYYWPLATDRSLGLWMPLVDCSRAMGCIRFVRGSHRYGDLGGQQISDQSAQHFDQFIGRERLEIHQTEELAAGDCTFHLGWTVHGAPANHSAAMREAMIVTFYPDGTRVDTLGNPSRVNDARVFLGGRAPGELADSELNTVVYRAPPGA